MERIHGGVPTVRRVTSCSSKITIPRMIDDSRLPFRIMRGVLKIGEFSQVISPDKITGPRAGDLRAILEGKASTKHDVNLWAILFSGELCTLREGKTRPGDALNLVSLADQRAYCKGVLRGTGKKLRGMTVAEWESVPDDIKSKMTQKHSHFFWTETMATERSYPCGELILAQKTIEAARALIVVIPKTDEYVKCSFTGKYFYREAHFKYRDVNTGIRLVEDR